MMSPHVKIHRPHLERLAYVYIRQSSPRQVEQNLESQDLQYQLVHRAQTLGWGKEQIVVIDDDLGKTAVTSANRQGFQELVSEVGLGRVGIILVTDVSRLARNCGDWYQLLDLASVCGTLVSDASGVYDPRSYDDRMLLGLKGAFAEAQWYNMRTQLIAAQLNKARRGELVIRLPVGYDRVANGEVVCTPDREVQGAIQLVFEQFECLGSGQAVLRYFRERELELPRRVQSGPDKGDIEWVRASYGIIHRILTHPAYAGAYTYGKRQRIRRPGAEGKTIVRLLPMEEWVVLKHDAFPSYISWEQYLKNKARLQENAQGAPWSKGAPRTGLALLQGIVICARCGRHMQVRYGNRVAYVCEVTRREYGDPTCQTFTVPHIDAAIVRIFLEAVQPAHLEVALAALEQIEVQRQRLVTQWEQRLERGRYEAELARRRYERVDPDMRLVAAELEQRWEEKLQAQQRLQREWLQVQAQELPPLTETDKTLIRHLAQDVPALWDADTTTQEERKRQSYSDPVAYWNDHRG
jgi:DNA invertase Pin-like site-specific DNA recombinase